MQFILHNAEQNWWLKNLNGWLFKEYSMWGSDIKIYGIDGGAENKTAYDNDDNHSDEEDENEETTAQTGSQNIESFIVQEF